MKPSEPLPVKLFCGVLFSDEKLRDCAYQRLQERFGPVDYRSPVFPFDCTDYYRDEMGWPIDRQFISLFSLISPKELPEIKIACNQIEDELAPSGRKVNLDAGYLDYDKVVLASAKYNAHKIYLDHGIYADLTLSFHRGVFEPSAYAFPDFKSGAYNSVFFHIRCKYKGQMRRWLSENQVK
ncbi:MAG TPA: DUF4416 family protein [bacterium]|jgi:hypothetical protein|nr:DUF4416 family protein [bacterium]HNT64891.1 DUF4416 family protein [bacterium]HOX84942.1 DUF4416 family protein [bacterium]HPG44192.1 DUF4416 family protein [bacterium]HPM96559.1 DUF4416 family protein [bacterium]